MAEVEIIKASQIKQENFKCPNKILKVAAYCRVSTDADEQLESYKSQVSYYTKIIDENPEWQKVAIYADEAITGTMVDKRESFQKMINDCMAGKIDLIITKSISRFARNTLDVLQYVRMLKERRIAIKFEEENINTLTMEGELLLSILSAVYQQEVENTSANVKKGLRMKMQRGELVGFQGCLGYNYDPETKMISLNEEEAEIVRMIFRLYLKGNGCRLIARELEKRGYKTKRGNSHWTDASLLGILKNEKYKGDIRMGKTFTVDPINKRRLRNMGESDQVYIHDHHPAIVTVEEFAKVQELRKVRGKNYQKGRADEDLLSGTGKYVFSNMLKCGFCGGTPSRRSWHSGTKYERTIWHCQTSAKYGKKNCPESCGVPEEAIQKAFVQSYTQTSNMNHDVVQETLARLRASLENEAYEDRIKEVGKEIWSLEKKIDQLLDLRLEQKIPEDIYEKKFKRLNRKLEEKKEKREKLQLAQGKQENTEKRIQKLKNLLQSHEELQEFDADVFLSIVKKVIIGGYDENGVSQPMKIKFIYKTGMTDSLDGSTFRSPRINAKKRKQKTDKMESLKQADVLNIQKSKVKVLPSFSTDNAGELPSLAKNKEGSAKKDVFRFAQKSEESCMRKKDLNGILPVATEVDAIWPCTSASGGESTALLLTGGEVAVFENCSSWTLATVYAERAGRDLRTLRTLTGGIFGDTKASILPINLSLVLVALKYRRSGNGSRQSTVCYVNAAHECRIVKNPVRGNCGAVRFPSGYVLPLLWSEQTLQTKLARGRLVQYRQAVYLRQELSQLESSVRSIYEGGLLA